ncbi:MAG: extracellular solute-binding protein, partial [Candidatus Sumerlaeota bacterium]|nr:extracellular solute-binding protein [Candidatus Sumerlaeota bacterium]
MSETNGTKASGWASPLALAALTTAFIAAMAASSGAAAPGADAGAPIVLRAWGVPEDVKADIDTLARQAIMAEFQRRFPHIKPVASTGLRIPGRTMDVLPLMQIAGDIPGHVMYVNFRMSDTYIANKFLYPLDRCIENAIGLTGGVAGGHLLKLDEYLSRLKAAPRYKDELEERVPYQCWQVMRRKCPYGADCPYLREWGEAPADKHFHTWCFPEGPLVIGLFYRRDLFQEAGLPDRVPDTLDELLDWARKLTNLKAKQYGLKMGTSDIAWSTLSFLYSYGGLLVQEDENGQWRCAYDSPPAIDAYNYLARLFIQPFENEHGRQTQLVYQTDDEIPGDIRYAMFFEYLDEKFFGRYDPAQWGFGPVPKGPTGLRASEFNSRMAGIYAGCDAPTRDAAWEYIRYYDGPEAGLIRAKVFVDQGLGHYILPDRLRALGYPKIAERVPKGWEESFRVALEHGIPEPYGKNCQQIYRYASQSIDQLLTDPVVRQAVVSGAEEAAKARIGAILADGVQRNNEKMLGIIPPARQSFRNGVAGLAATLIILVFALVFRRVFRVFAESEALERGPASRGLQLIRYRWAYLLLIPAAGSIALWEYYPLARGSVMAFQNYNVRGFSQWIGFNNLANVLFDAEFWYAMWISLKWAVLFLLFGFCAPIILALLLTETPRGKLFFRLIYYLPAVLSGVLVVYLWKGFFGPEGAINQALNFLISLLN